MSRRSEIEAKRARIAELRRQRDLISSKGSDAAPQAVRPAPDRSDIDELVNSLVGSSPKVSPGPETPAPTKVEDTAPESVDSSQWTSVVTSVLSIGSSKPVLTYSKEVQTDDWLEPESDSQDGELSEPQLSLIEARLRAEIEQKLEAQTKDAAVPESAEPLVVNELDGERVDEITQSKDFSEFWGQSWKIINRALDEDYDILVNYGDAGKSASAQDSAESSITQVAQLHSQQSADRAITSIEWSTKFPELIAASYTESSVDPTQSKGLVQVWNVHSKSRAEYSFIAPSDVLRVRFSPFDAHLLFGASYNGQLLAWDMRSGPRPVLTSHLSSRAHTHPVYSLQVVGTQNTATLVSASTDGTVCTWMPDVFARPQDKISLLAPFGPRNEEAAPTSLAVSSRDPAQFLVGTEEGSIYQCHRYAQAGTKAGYDPRGVYKGHRGPVTSIDLHPSRGNVDLSNFMLSSGTDWSIKLWSVQPLTGPASAAEGISPSRDILREDVVYDVAWCPSQGTVFGAVDGTGHFEVWDLAKDGEAPLARAKPTSLTGQARPLSKLAWDKTTASRVAVGGLDGALTIFEIDQSLLAAPKADDWAHSKRVLSERENR